MAELWPEEELIPIRDRVYAYLKNAILEGTYKAGDRLVERELAEKLNISRTPIREALLKLESQGFVRTLPRKGVVVAEISHEEILEIFTILSALEVLAVKLAAQKMDQQTMEKLDEAIEKIDRVLKGELDVDIMQFHLEINETLYKAAKSPKLYELLIGLMDYIRAFAHLGYETPGRMRRSMEEHRDIMLAVKNREAEMAEYLTRIHIENSKKAFINAIKKEKK
ncbi:GntR family transcriptional regulator [Bacillaceae bacterium]